MPSWNSDQYLKFESERTRPARDLTSRVVVDAPRRVIDLGCGPGNSTAVLAERWPDAEITGLDASETMIGAARALLPRLWWTVGDIGTWSADEDGRFDVVFSNAALQWVPDHAHTLPRLLARVNDGGALALQMPANLDAPPHRLMREVAASPAWRDVFLTPPREWHVGTPAAYYDMLAPHSARIDLWCTDYVHVLESVDDVIEWYRGTGLRPWLDALPDATTRDAFVADYRAALAPVFAPRADGKVLFPFRRLFVVAYR